VTVEAQEYMHEFAVPHCSLWQYRSPGDWLQDLWQASTGPEGETELCVNWAQDTEVAGVGAVWSIHCTGSERALRWVCVALNQHAEQSPGDLTPPEQAERLELVLAGQRFVLVAEGIRTNDGRLVPVGVTSWADVLPVLDERRAQVGVIRKVKRQFRSMHDEHCVVVGYVQWDDPNVSTEGYVLAAEGGPATRMQPQSFVSGAIFERFDLRAAQLVPDDAWAWHGIELP
jgi:hypothetical protein